MGVCVRKSRKIVVDAYGADGLIPENSVVQATTANLNDGGLLKK
jgi:hypothetical protein